MAEQPMVLRANECLLEAEAILRNLVIAESTRAQGGRNRPQTRRYVMRDAKADARRALDQIGAARLALLGTEAFLDMPLGVASGSTEPAQKATVTRLMRLAASMRHAHPDQYDDAYKALQSAIYDALGVASGSTVAGGTRNKGGADAA